MQPRYEYLNYAGKSQTKVAVVAEANASAALSRDARASRKRSLASLAAVTATATVAATAIGNANFMLAFVFFLGNNDFQMLISKICFSKDEGESEKCLESQEGRRSTLLCFA